MRPTDLIPKAMIPELLRLGKLDRNWIEHEKSNESRWHYIIKPRYDTWLSKLCRSGADWDSMLAQSIWLADGPKVFQPTMDQCKALENVSVNISVDEYHQSYPSLVVQTPYPPYSAVLCHHITKSNCGPLLICLLLSPPSHDHDITTCVSCASEKIEDALVKFHDDCEKDQQAACPALRVACNSCLALAHYGSHLDYLFPKEVQRDKKLAQENSERGIKAKARLQLPVQVISFDQEIKLHRTEVRKPEPGEPTGRQTPCHWRRGHWHTVCHGPKSSLRKLAFFAPVLVRSDLFVGDPADTQATYR